MTNTLASLKPQIRAILSAPGTDLGTVSAKRVRKQLVVDDQSLEDFVRDNKDEVNKFIAEVYEEVNLGTAGSSGDSTKRKHTKDDADDDDDSKTPKKSKREGSQMSDDEAYARQLAQELNGRSTRRAPPQKSPSKRAKTGKNVKNVKNVKKSAETIDTDSDDDAASPSRPRKKTTSPKKRTGGTGGGFAKEMALSEPLSAVLQADKLPRTQVVKNLWIYIKANSLQNPKNGREILCDGPLRAVFGCDKVNMFKMNQLLGQHLHDPNEL